MNQPKLTRRSFLGAAAATSAAAALALSGCGSSASSSSASSAASDAKVAEKITAALANKMSNNNPIGMNGGSATGIAATWHVFESLYDLDVHDYTTYNALAADKPKVIDDTHYEVTLRDGAKYSTGDDVVAADVVKAFQACREDANIGEFLAWMKSVEAKDDKTVAFELNYPFASLFEVRCSLVKVVPSSQTPDELKTMPIGSGPWKYVSISNDDGGMIEFAPNEYYNGAYPATCQAMSWNALQDPDARTTALTDGSALAINALPVANADVVNGVGASVDFVPGFNQPFLMFNTKRAPFSDVRVRQAIHYAIDKETLISNIEDGHATPATSFLTKEMPNYHEASTVYTYDPDKARELLSEAGVTDLKLTLLTNTTFVKALVPQIVNDLAAVGIDATPDIQDMPWSKLNEADPDFDVVLTGGDATCFGNDPDILMGWWYNDNLWMNARTCWKVTSPDLWQELQDLMQEARESSDEKAQQEAWNQCFDIIAENCPLYPLYHQDMVTGYYESKLQGFEPISTTGLIFLGTTPVE